MIDRILVAVDGSQQSQKAFDFAMSLAKKYNSILTVISVIKLPDYIERTEKIRSIEQDLTRQFTRLHEDLAEAGRTNGVEVISVIEFGHPADKVIEFANNGNFDLVILGSKGQSKVERFHLGATSDKVSHHCTVPVLIVK